MSTVSDAALNVAIAIEVKKDGLAQKQSGDWVLRFTVQAADMDQRLVMAAMGQRFQAALVAIDDNEMPKEVMPNSSAERLDNAQAPSIAAGPMRERTPWSELTPTVQCVLRCEQPAFQAFLREEYNERCVDANDAAQIVRKLCGVNTRAAFQTSHLAAGKWRQIDNQFQAWQRI